MCFDALEDVTEGCESAITTNHCGGVIEYSISIYLEIDPLGHTFVDTSMTVPRCNHPRAVIGLTQLAVTR